MPRCAQRGCGQEFSVTENTETSCCHHPGAPIFHEGLKSWSCCSSINKPVFDFDEFMAIPVCVHSLRGGTRSPLTVVGHAGKGCEVGAHTEAVPQVVPQAAKPVTTEILTMTGSTEGKETYSTVQTLQRRTSATPATALLAKPIPLSFPEEEDDLSVAIVPGTPCKRKGCSIVFASDAENRIGNGEGTVCTYHPAPPIFHEGSKGYLCCKRRVLEFEEFLKIEGCKKGRHVFVPKQSASEGLVDHFTECRVDHYQTPSEVHVSVFAKQADEDKSKVTVEETQVGAATRAIITHVISSYSKNAQVHFDLYLPAQKRFKRTIQLFGPVMPERSSYKFFGTKVEVVLKKLDTRSWSVLEKTTRDLGNLNLTFGVSGRIGTIGGKDIILDEQNRNRAM